MSAKPTHPSYNDGSDQDEPQKQPPKVFCKKGALRNFAKLTGKHLCQTLFLFRLSSQEWHNCQNCEKMPTRLECMCCHKIPEVKAFNLKGKARLSSNITDLEFVEVVVRRCFPK